MTVSPPFRVVIIGGSYAGLSVVQNLFNFDHGIPLEFPLNSKSLPVIPEGIQTKRRVEIVLVDERDGFFHTLGTPLAHVARKYVDKFWLRYDDVDFLKR
jgi:hypothetical protein